MIIKNQSVKLITQYLFSCVIILSCLATAKFTMHFIGGSFPAPLLGMLILLSLLLMGIIKESQVTPCASPLLNFMPLFFIPAGVGFIEHLGLIQQHWQFLAAIIILVPLSSILLISHLIAAFKGRAQYD